MISIEEARRIILSHSQRLGAEEVPILHSLGRIAAEDTFAPWDIPAADHSAMDGCAFAHADAAAGDLTICGFLPAGETRTEPVLTGCAVKIMTGAPLPPGCDTVVPQEDVEESDGVIRFTGTVKKGDHVRCRGEDVTAGERVISTGACLRPQELGMLSSLGKTAVAVFRRVRVAVLSTGDELIQPGSMPVPGKIINSNSFSIAAQVLEAGGEPVMLGIARDDREITRTKILEGMQADVLITTGGVSVGDRDFVREALQELGGEILFWKVAMKPGKPVAFAMVRGKPVFALPGNPVAAMVAFEQFVRPSLLKMMGHSRIFRPIVRGTLVEAAANRGNRPHLVRCAVELVEGCYVVSVTGNQSSARLSSLTSCNGLLKLPPDSLLDAGAEVDVQLLDRHFEMGEGPSEADR